MARWTASEKWAAGPALDGQRDMPLAPRLSEGLGFTVLTIRQGFVHIDIGRFEAKFPIQGDCTLVVTKHVQRYAG